MTHSRCSNECHSSPCSSHSARLPQDVATALGNLLGSGPAAGRGERSVRPSLRGGGRDPADQLLEDAL